MPQIRLNDSQQRTRRFQAAVSKQLTLLQMGKDQQAKAMCMSRSTLWTKLQAPDEFRVGELTQLYKILNFPEEDKRILF